MAEIRIGVITDSHRGEFEERIVEDLKNESLDLAVFLGDSPRDINGHNTEKYANIRDTLIALDRLNLPVFCIPGNYESVVAYENAFRLLEDRLDNVMDMSKPGKNKTAFSKNGLSLDLVFVPGAKDFSRGYLVDPNHQTGRYEDGNGPPVSIFNPLDILRLVNRPERTLILAHSPMRLEGERTFDLSMRAVDSEGNEIVGPSAHELIRGGMGKPIRVHVGNEILAKIVDRLGVKKFLSGDIHEAGFTTNRAGNLLAEGEFSDEVFGNPGAAVEGFYGVLVYRMDNKAALHRGCVS